MYSNQLKLFIEINNIEFIFAVGHNAEDLNDFKIVHNLTLPIQGINESKITDFDLVYNILKKNIYDIEQKLNFVFKDVILVIDNFDCSLINFSGFKKLNGSQLAKENIIYILNSLKSKINEVEKDKTILHIFNSEYLLDKKKVENLPIGLFGNLYCHELSFFLINTNDYKNLKNIFNKCNLKLNRIISKNFIEGVNLIETNNNNDAFFKIDLNENISQISFYENSSLKFVQNFNFGTNLILNDICKVLALKQSILKNILLDSNLSKKNTDDQFIEKKFFNGDNFRKIKKKLIFDIGQARIQEIAELVLLKNINVVNFLNKKKKIFLKISEKLAMENFKNLFSLSFSNKNNLEIKFIEKITEEDVLNNVQKIVQYGWKREAVPIVEEKRSIIARFFNLIFK